LAAPFQKKEITGSVDGAICEHVSEFSNNTIYGPS